MTQIPRRPGIDRRSLLKGMGAAAASPLVMSEVLASPSHPLPKEAVDIDPYEWANLFLVQGDKPIWGPGVDYITRSNDPSVDATIRSVEAGQIKMDPKFRPLAKCLGICIRFKRMEVFQTMTITGSQLIHRPTRTKFDPMYFSSHANLVSGDAIILNHNITG